MFRRVVVPLDGSEMSERALPHAEELARLIGAPIRVIRVVDLGKLAGQAPLAFGVAPGALQRALDDEEQAAREYVERMARDLTARGLAATGELRRGVAEREVIAATRPGDVIVMATHGRGGMVRWFLGSVAEEVTRRSPVPVMLVRSIPAETTNGHRADAVAVEAGALLPEREGSRSSPPRSAGKGMVYR